MPISLPQTTLQVPKRYRRPHEPLPQFSGHLSNISLVIFYGSDFFTDYDLIFLFFKTHVTDPKRRLEDGFMFVLMCAGVR